MRIQAALLLILAMYSGVCEATTLSLPDHATLTFEAPPLNKIAETNESARYTYLASSAGTADERFNLSVYVEPIDCDVGESTQEVTQCFLKRAESIPGLLQGSMSTRCDDIRCEVIYVTVASAGDHQVRQLNVNTLFTYRGRWVDLHISVLNPTRDDSKILAHFAASLLFEK